MQWKLEPTSTLEQKWLDLEFAYPGGCIKSFWGKIAAGTISNQFELI
jgi:hypothetical protein